MTEYTDTIQNISFKDLQAEDMIRLSHMFHMRPNKSCDSGPLCNYLYKEYYNVRWCELDKGGRFCCSLSDRRASSTAFPRTAAKRTSRTISACRSSIIMKSSGSRSSSIPRTKKP